MYINDIYELKYCLYLFFFFKQKTAYEIRNCDWSSDVCSSDLGRQRKKGRKKYRYEKRDKMMKTERNRERRRENLGDRKSVV